MEIAPSPQHCDYSIAKKVSMSKQAPTLFTGTLYGSAQLEVLYCNGNMLTSSPVWVRLQLERLQWQIAIPQRYFSHQLYNNSYLGKLSNIVFPPNATDAGLNIPELNLEEIRSPMPACINEELFADWLPSTYFAGDFPSQYELLNVLATNGSSLCTHSPESPALYASIYQLANRITPQCITLPSQATLHIACEPSNEHFLVSLWSDSDWSTYQDATLLAVELLANSPAQKIRSINNTEHTFYLTARHVPNARQLTRLKLPDFWCLEQIVHRLASLPPEDFQRFKISTLHHLHAKALNGPIEIRYIMEMTWVEILDGENTLQATSTAALLGIDEIGAHFINVVRHKLIHETGTLSDAVTAARVKIFQTNAINNKIEQLAYTHRIERSLDLDLKNVPEIEIALAFRLCERIDTAIWTFLGFAPNSIERSRLVRWPNHQSAPIPVEHPKPFAHLPIFPQLTHQQKSSPEAASKIAG
ncbi:hypothetical protein [Comamonas sp. GB3 AK4-5]|uniref:hypothetical protein n=1 Tax=Comamonas sp. GB3 AK4-5 TaxID=3231487 RepID=UPI00351E611E